MGNGAGPLDRSHAQPDEEHEHEALREGKRRLGLRRRHDEQHRDPLEQLRDQHEDVQVRGEDDADRGGRTPRASPVLGVVRDDYGGQNHEGHGPHYVGRQELDEGKAESAGIREDGGDQKDGGPTVEPGPRRKGPCRDEAGDDAHQTQHGVDEGECRDAHAEDHGVSLGGAA